jgi:dolichol-phosphate mannosyltransferase
LLAVTRKYLVKQAEPNSPSNWMGSASVNAATPEIHWRLVGVGLSGMAIDILVFWALFALGAHVEASQIASFFAAAIVILVPNARRALAQPRPTAAAIRGILNGRFLLVFIAVLLLRSAVLILLIGSWYWRPQTAIMVAVLIATPFFLVGAVLFVLPDADTKTDSAIRWPTIAVAIVAYLLVLKLIFINSVNLIPEEAYYWNYAQRLDWGYLDHPPMIAWLIWLSTSVLGKSELSVRLPAYICWIVTAVFMFRLTLNLFDRPAALRAILLLAVLPIYFGIGLFMTPDAPLCAAWAGCLYFLERALVAQHRRAWWWAGLCLGIGMLSKYTIALLGLGTFIFFLVDKRSRRWLCRPDPYVAGVIALILFSPVLLWNVGNDWASFAFQGSGRWSGKYGFSLHVLIGSIFLLLTPTGALAIVQMLISERTIDSAETYQSETAIRLRLWAAVFTLAPLSVFVVHSLFSQSKMNWTAPIWLAAIPFVAWDMVARSGEHESSMTEFTRRLWMPTVIALLFILGASFCYLSLGLPGAGPMTGERLFGEWRLLAERVDTIEKLVKVETGSEPIIVGMDKNFISSELSFYSALSSDGPKQIGGSHLVGRESLMWAFWFPPSAAVGKNLLMIELNRNRLLNPALGDYFEKIGEIHTETLEKYGRVVGRVYWRLGYGYRGRANLMTSPP